MDIRHILITLKKVPSFAWYALGALALCVVALGVWVVPISHSWVASQLGIEASNASVAVIPEAPTPAPQIAMSEQVKELSDKVTAFETARQGDLAQMAELKGEFQKAISEVGKTNDSLSAEAEKLNAIARSIGVTNSVSTPSPQNAPSSVAPTTAPDLVNINTATAEQLDALPSIGPTYAKRIVDYRNAHGPFKSIDDLGEVSGIGPATLEKIRTLVTV
jgi:competence protein ComEA